VAATLSAFYYFARAHSIIFGTHIQVIIIINIIIIIHDRYY